MLYNASKTTLTVFPQTGRDSDILKDKTGATKKWIIGNLVEEELKRVHKNNDVMEVAA